MNGIYNLGEVLFAGIVFSGFWNLDSGILIFSCCSLKLIASDMISVEPSEANHTGITVQMTRCTGKEITLRTGKCKFVLLVASATSLPLCRVPSTL